MKLHALLATALLANLPVLVVLAAPAGADPDPCVDVDVHVGYLPVLVGNPCTQGDAYACVPRNKQGDFDCHDVGLWCWCPGPVIA